MKRALLVLALLTGCATTAPQNDIAKLTEGRAIWAIHVEDDDGTVVYSQNADKLMIPASNRKLYASAAIVDCVGIDAQINTDIYRDGEDLVVRGDGDPSLGSWRYERDHDFDFLAQKVTRVHDVIADVSAFDRLTIPGGWKYGNLGADYAAPVDALAWDENEVPLNRAVDDAGLATANALRDALVAHGVEVTGVARVNTEPRAWQERIASIPSPFVGQLLQTMLKNSHNLYAEMLLKRLAGTYDGAFAIERAFLQHVVEPDAFRFVDGSGLAPDDLVTARSTVRLLRWMNDPSRHDFWWATLAQPNNDGTLHQRLVDLEDRLRGKTGTINGVAALSGIIAMPGGRYRYFSIMVNHHNLESATTAIDAVVELLASS